MSKTRTEGGARPGRLGWIALVSVLTAVAFSSGWRAPFVYDDLPAIQVNPSIHRASLGSWLTDAPPQTPVSGRPVANTSFALNVLTNAALGVDQRSDPEGPNKTIGFHVVNVILHVCNALLILTLARRALAAHGKDPVTSLHVAGAIALLWAVHPIQSEAVFYVTQRTELLVSLFMLLVIYASARAWESARPVRWYFAGFLFAVLGVGSKEVMAVAPALVLLYDRFMLERRWRELFANRGRLAFYASLLIAPMLVAVTVAVGARSRSVGFDLGVTSKEYLHAQGWAIWRYLRLIAWPAGLTFDYGEATARSPGSWIGLASLFGVAMAAIVAMVRGRATVAACFALSFLVLLLPSSSVVPIKTEVAAERRVYLASVFVIAAIVVGAMRLASRIRVSNRGLVTGGAVAATVLALLTFRRGEVYGSQERLFLDTVAKVPSNPRAHVGLGLALMVQGPSRLAEATSHFRAAVAADPSNTLALRSLGLATFLSEDWSGTVDAYSRLLRIDQSNLDDVDRMARALVALGRYTEALPFIQQLGTADAELLEQAGMGLANGDNARVAVALLEGAAKTGRLSPTGLATLALAYASLGDKSGAMGAARAAAQAPTATPLTLLLAGKALVQAGQNQAGQRLLGEARRRDPSVEREKD